MGVGNFVYGVRRVVIGLCKKLLIANVVGVMADRVFDMPVERLGTGTAWFGLICFTLQIYFALSGYSDMAIGLGRMLGFRLPENFRWPYVAETVQIMAPLDDFAVDLVERDYIFAARRRQRHGRPPAPPCAAGRSVRVVRAVARYQLESCRLGSVSRHLHRPRAPGGSLMNYKPIAQDYTGTYHRIVFDTTVFTNMRVVVNYTTRYRTIRTNNNPIIER